MVRWSTRTDQRESRVSRERTNQTVALAATASAAEPSTATSKPLPAPTATLAPSTTTTSSQRAIDIASPTAKRHTAISSGLWRKLRPMR